MTHDQECREFVRILTTTPLENGQSIRQATEYDNLCLWWFADFEMIKLLLGIPPHHHTDFMPAGLAFQGKLCRLPRWGFSLLNIGFDFTRKSLLLLIQGLYEKEQLKTKNLKKPLILFNAEDLYWRSYCDPQTGQSEQTDIFFHPILKCAEDHYHLNFVGTYPFVKYIYPPSEFSRATKTLVDRYKNGNIAYKSFNRYWNFRIASKEMKAGKLFRKRWKALENDPALKRLCVFKGVDRFGLIKKQLWFFFYILFPYIAKRLELARSLLSELNPDLLLLVNEYGHFERSLLIAAKERNIPVLAIQHGNFTPSHQGYIYHRDDISPDGAVTEPFCPIPDLTTVWGSCFKRLLTETSAYPENKVVVTGNPGYDILSQIRESCTREDVLKPYQIDPSKKIVLWTTQSHGLTDEENQKNINAVNQAAGELPDCVFIIKQHPNEPEKYTRFYESQKQSVLDNIVIVPPKANILELILTCDMMMAKWSTTIIEAMAMDKDIVVLNLGSDRDRADYVRQNIAAGVYRADDLAETIRKIVDKRINLAEKRREYVHDYLYKVDAQATKRIVELINNEISDES
jgi:UDP-N-acetylglucosamine 2-epimerase